MLKQDHNHGMGRVGKDLKILYCLMKYLQCYIAKELVAVSTVLY